MRGRSPADRWQTPLDFGVSPGVWSLDFVADQFIDGRRMRILVVVDDCTRECLALVPDTSISGVRVTRELLIIPALRLAREPSQTAGTTNGLGPRLMRHRLGASELDAAHDQSQWNGGERDQHQYPKYVDVSHQRGLILHGLSDPGDRLLARLCGCATLGDKEAGDLL
jgi:hypothetical protein